MIWLIGLLAQGVHQNKIKSGLFVRVSDPTCAVFKSLTCAASHHGIQTQVGDLKTGCVGSSRKSRDSRAGKQAVFNKNHEKSGNIINQSANLPKSETLCVRRYWMPLARIVAARLKSKTSRLVVSFGSNSSHFSNAASSS